MIKAKALILLLAFFGNASESVGSESKTQPKINEVLPHGEESEQIEQSKYSADEWYLNALLRIKEKDFEGAVKDYSIAISLEPGISDYYLNRGLALNSLKRFDEAIADFDKVLELDPSRIAAYTSRANSRRHKGDFDGALSDLDAAISLPDTDSRIGSSAALTFAYDQRGSLLLALGRTEESIHQYDIALASSNYPFFYAGKANALLVAGRDEEALSAYDSFIGVFPDMPFALRGRAVAHDRLGSLEEAIADCSKANELSEEEVPCNGLEKYVLSKLIEK